VAIVRQVFRPSHPSFVDRIGATWAYGRALAGADFDVAERFGWALCRWVVVTISLQALKNLPRQALGQR
jgi:hypothetical protein